MRTSIHALRANTLCKTKVCIRRPAPPSASRGAPAEGRLAVSHPAPAAALAPDRDTSLSYVTVRGCTHIDTDRKSPFRTAILA